MFLIKSKTQSSNLPLQFIVSRHLFLLGHTNSFSLVASGLGMLSSGSEAPVVSQTSMSPNLLQTLQILSTFTPSSRASPYSALACRPDMLRLVPARVQEICSLLAMVQDGKTKRMDMSGSAVGDEDAPEHLFLRFGRSGKAAWGEK